MIDLDSPLSTLASALLSVSSTLVLWLVLRPTVFGPLQLAALDHRFTRPGADRSRFRMVELAMLIVQLQGVAALVTLLPLSADQRLLATTCSWILLLVWWWEGVTLLSHAHVTTSRDRLFFLGILIPLGSTLATLLAVFAPAVPIGAVFLFCLALVDQNPAALWGCVALLSVGTLHLVAVTWARRACQTIATRAELDAPAATA